MEFGDQTWLYHKHAVTYSNVVSVLGLKIWANSLQRLDNFLISYIMLLKQHFFTLVSLIGLETETSICFIQDILLSDEVTLYSVLSNFICFTPAVKLHYGIKHR